LRAGQALAGVFRLDQGRYTGSVEYEWDPEKDRINREKHGVSFAEVATVFWILSISPFEMSVTRMKNLGSAQSAIPPRIA
jgi:hypothetical protein